MLRAALLTCALAAGAILAGPVVDEPSSGSAHAASGGGTAREHATRRDPVKLWYRFEVRFRGTVNSSGQGERPGGLVQAYTDATEGGYLVTSRSATLVTRTCVVRNRRGVKGFSVARSCRDARSHPKIRRNKVWRRQMREEVGFRANLTGRITNGGHRRTEAPAAVLGLGGRYEACSGASTAIDHQATPQRAIGVLATSRGSGSAVDVKIQPDGNSWVRSLATARVCPKYFDIDENGKRVQLIPPGTLVIPAVDKLERRIWQPLDASWALAGRPIRERLSFKLPPKAFGKRYGFTRRLTGTTAGVAGSTATARFVYTFTMRPCPRGGRQAKGC